jgi:hypothetical protein
MRPSTRYFEPGSPWQSLRLGVRLRTKNLLSRIKICPPFTRGHYFPRKEGTYNLMNVPHFPQTSKLEPRSCFLTSGLRTGSPLRSWRLCRRVKRNRDRFPEDFMLQLNNRELECLRCQNGTSQTGHGGTRYLPYAFTEHRAQYDSLQHSTADA